MSQCVCSALWHTHWDIYFISICDYSKLAYRSTFVYVSICYGLPWWLRWLSICLQYRRPGFDPWVWKIPWRRKWQPTPVLLPGKFQGWRNLVGYSPWGCKELDTTERLHFPFSLQAYICRGHFWKAFKKQSASQDRNWNASPGWEGNLLFTVTFFVWLFQPCICIIYLNK